MTQTSSFCMIFAAYQNSAGKVCIGFKIKMLWESVKPAVISLVFPARKVWRGSAAMFHSSHVSAIQTRFPNTAMFDAFKKWCSIKWTWCKLKSHFLRKMICKTCKLLIPFTSKISIYMIIREFSS